MKWCLGKVAGSESGKKFAVYIRITATVEKSLMVMAEIEKVYILC